MDYLTYVFAPIVLLWQLGYLPPGMAGIIIAVIPLLASSYQFSQANAKTEDHSFLGFPSYWNVVAFYAIVLDVGRTGVAISLVVLTVLVFVPVRYLYPSHTPVFRTLTLALGGLWGVLMIAMLWQMPAVSPAIFWASLVFPVYYLMLSLALDARRWIPR